MQLANTIDPQTPAAGLFSGSRSSAFPCVANLNRSAKSTLVPHSTNGQTGANSSNTGQTSQARSPISNRKRKLPCGQPIETVLNQESDRHDDNGKGQKNH
jgi:hypothetical protein